jgi:hypothetical protein
MEDLVLIRFNNPYDSCKRPRQRWIAAHFQRRNNHRPGLACSLDSVFEGAPILRIQRSQTQIDDLYVMFEAPIDSPDDHTQVSGEFAVKDFYRNQIGFRIQMVDDRRDGSTVTKVIFVASDRSVRGDGDAIDDLAHVGMCAADAAIQNTDSHWLVHPRQTS